jgi:hypothetical protein
VREHYIFRGISIPGRNSYFARFPCCEKLEGIFHVDVIFKGISIWPYIRNLFPEKFINAFNLRNIIPFNKLTYRVDDMSDFVMQLYQ